MKAPAWRTETEYDDTGEGGLPVVLIHAFPLHRGMWEPQLPLAEGRRLIRYDVRGFGRTPLGDPQAPFELYVEDLLSLLDHLELKKTVLCGLSMGGYIALRAVERAPERVSALVLCDTKSGADGNEARLKRAVTALRVKREGLEKFAEGFIPGAFAPSSLKKPGTLAQVQRLIAANQAPGVCAALLAMAGRTDTTASLARILAPTLVVVGEQDALTPPPMSEAMAKLIPGAKLATIPDAGHLSNLENPAAFNAAVGSFLGRLSRL